MAILSHYSICPKHIIQMVGQETSTVNMCSNQDKGADARKACSNACIGCKKCEKACPHGAITVKNNLAIIDYEKCTNCGKCAEVCFSEAITVFGKEMTVEEAFDTFIELIQEYQRQKDSHKDKEIKTNEGTAEVLPDIMVIDEMPAVKMRDLIIEIIKRPPMYLGDYSLEKLYYYLKGFVMSHTEADDGCLDGFDAFVSEKFSINASVAWWKIISIFGSTEKEAFYKFVNLLHEYWQE